MSAVAPTVAFDAAAFDAPAVASAAAPAVSLARALACAPTVTLCVVSSNIVFVVFVLKEAASVALADASAGVSTVASKHVLQRLMHWLLHRGSYWMLLQHLHRLLYQLFDWLSHRLVHRLLASNDAASVASVDASADSPAVAPTVAFAHGGAACIC